MLGRSILLAVVAKGAEPPAGYSTLITYYLKNDTGVSEYLALAKPLADYVASSEPTTLTYRFFVNHEDHAVRILSRFNSDSDFSDIHEASPLHVEYMANVAAWAESTDYVVAKEKGRWDETDYGVLIRDDETGEPAGYSQSVTYYFANENDAATYRSFLQPLARAVAEDEPRTLSYRPFVSEDGCAVRSLGRFADYSSYKDVHTTSHAHDVYIQAVNDWNASTAAIVRKTKGGWNETDLGVFLRARVYV